MGPAGFVGGAIIALSVYMVASASFGKSPALPLGEEEIEVPRGEFSFPSTEKNGSAASEKISR